MVQVQSTWFPLVDRNPQTFVDIYTAKEADFHKATQRVYRARSCRRNWKSWCNPEPPRTAAEIPLTLNLERRIWPRRFRRPKILA